MRPPDTIEIPRIKFQDFKDGYQFGSIVVREIVHPNGPQLVLVDNKNRVIYMIEKIMPKVVTFRLSKHDSQRFEYLFSHEATAAPVEPLSNGMSFAAGTPYPAANPVFDQAKTITVGGMNYFDEPTVRRLIDAMCAKQREICEKTGSHYKFTLYKYKKGAMLAAPAPPITSLTDDGV